ncbi:MAG: hypothetical protein LWW92_17240, partial [Rhodocyclales bacterium]|nr:hypothetical protein [Rhodocyclales bacterium]
ATGYDNSKEFKTRPSLGRPPAALKARGLICVMHQQNEMMFMKQPVAFRGVSWRQALGYGEMHSRV